MKTGTLDALARSLTGPFAFCGIAVAHGGAQHHVVSTAPGIVADADSLFRVASVSKLVVGQAIAAFVKTKATTWGTDISDILGWRLRHPDHPDRPVTLGMVASHSAGLTDAAGYLIPPDADLAAWCAARTVFDAPPGSRFSYCNLGYIMLAAALERLAGQRFPDAVSHLVPDPGGFNWVGVGPAQRTRRLPTYRRDSTGFVPQIDAQIAELPARGHPGIYSPQGGLRLSLRGMLTLAARLRDADRTPLWTPTMGSGDYLDGVFESYGAGLQIFEAPVFYPRPLIGHFGNAYGFNGGVWYDAATDLAFAYALNGLTVGDEDDAFSDAERTIFAAVAALKG